jgi:AcrR family transcriptional regulator
MLLSARQQAIQERDERILGAARDLFLERDYFGVTMDHIAARSECPKGTMYQHFRCKEDIIVALATEANRTRGAMMRRGLAFPGCTRERVLAMGEGVALFTRGHTGQSRLLHMATGPIREKAAPVRVASLVDAEHEAIDLLRGLIREAVAVGELRLQDDDGVEELAFGTWALVEGAFVIIENSAVSLLGINNPFHRLWRLFNVLADGYDWRPLFEELDWEESLSRVRRSIFPEEAQAVYGEGAWYGDGM